MMRTANPALNDKVFATYAVMTGQETMTLQGTVNKSFALLILVVATASWTWGQFFHQGPEAVRLWMMVGVLGGLGAALVTVFKKELAPITAPAYALLQGLALGGISATFEAMFPGIVIQAVGLTFGTLFALLAAYTSGLIKPSENFKLGVAAATGGIALLYLVSIGLGFFGVEMPMIHASGPIGIGFSLFVVVVAALNLVLDFDFIEQGSHSGAPKYMEWYAAFGLMVTLIWLYLEILRLLAKLQERR